MLSSTYIKIDHYMKHLGLVGNLLENIQHMIELLKDSRFK